MKNIQLSITEETILFTAIESRLLTIQRLLESFHKSGDKGLVDRYYEEYQSLIVLKTRLRLTDEV